MKKIIFSSLAMLFATAVSAQETYESATVADKDLNGTARYVGMGGAMEALGADISTMSSNPAGIGLFRKSQVSMSVGLQNVPGKSVLGGDNTKLGFDQIGIVLPIDVEDNTIVNIGLNYHKSKNFNQILSAANRLKGASQNKLSYLKGYEGVFYPDEDNAHKIIGWESETSNYTANSFTQLDYLYYNNFLLDPYDGQFYYEDATGFEAERVSRGYVSDFDMNLSANFNNRFYLGMTLGIQSMNYTSDSYYKEFLESGSSVLLDDYRHITGTGVSVKLGAILRPVEASPFRIGLYLHTPTWYKLTTENQTSLVNGEDKGSRVSVSEAYDFHLNTPWTFGLSLGHTIGTKVALGATYEYSDYSSLDNRIIDGGYYDYYDNYQTESTSDRRMNDCTEYCLRGVHTLKVGAEYKVTPQLALRAGYNYVSPKYNVDGYKDGSIDSYGSFYASQTDYVNWKATNRFTCGIGYSFGKFSADLAYQYSNTNGEYFPFMSYYSNDEPELDNICDKTDISDKRHRVLLTLGYRF